VDEPLLTPIDDGRVEPPPVASSAADDDAAVTPVNLREGRSAVETELDMTPMVDVTFLLLIFFMVTAAFSLQKSLEVPTPEETEASTQVKSLQDFENDPDFVVVRVDAYNTFHVMAADWDEAREAPSEQELLIQLRSARQANRSGVIPSHLLVVANAEALHKTVVKALDAGSAVGMEDVQMVTVEEDEE
jgi:biopolymer transport protein ExbD